MTLITHIQLNLWSVFFTLQISHKYGLIYAITKLGLLFVYDLETATAVYRNRISPDPIFLTSEASSVGGFYAINRRGQVLLATVNEATIVPFVSGQVCSHTFVLYGSHLLVPLQVCWILIDSWTILSLLSILLKEEIFLVQRIW